MTNQNSNGKKRIPPSSNAESGPNAKQFNQRPGPSDNGRGKIPVQDHAQWHEYLRSRHILEAAIAAGAWVEHSDYYGRNCLVWREKRRDGSPGARRRRFINPPVIKGDELGKTLWFSGEKTDEPFHYIGTLEELKAAIARNGWIVYIVEGEIDVWSMRALGFPNTVGIYGIGHIPKDIAFILDELGAAKVVYLADNDQAGARGASKLRALLREAGWRGKAEFRQVTGPGIPAKGDVNDLLRHCHPDKAAARAILDALPPLQLRAESQPAPSISMPSYANDPRWDPVKEAVRSALGVADYNRKGFSKEKFRCPDPQHEDPGPSANWHRNGFCYCFGCGKTFNAKQMAEFLGIPWRDLLGAQRQSHSSDKIDLTAAPPELEAGSAPPCRNEPPDSLLRLSNKVCSTMHSALYYFAARLRGVDRLPEAFSLQEFIDAARTLDCELKERAIYDNFEEARHGDEHPFFAKLDTRTEARSWNRKFRLRSAEDIQEQLLRRLRFRVFEEEFHADPDTIIDFEAFAGALLGSESAKALELALEPLYEAQKQSYERLVGKCEKIIARCKADLADLQITPLPPDWKIRKKSDLPAGMARAIFEADGENRSLSQWSKLLGISYGSVGTVLERAGIKRTSRKRKVTVSSKSELLAEAAKDKARIMDVTTHEGIQTFDRAMEIRGEATATLQPTAEHEIIFPGQPEIRPTPTQAQAPPEPESESERADNMEKPGKWRKASWDPQFRYWELIKICQLKHGYQRLKHRRQKNKDIGIYDPETGEVWINPGFSDLVILITGVASDKSAEFG